MRSLASHGATVVVCSETGADSVCPNEHLQGFVNEPVHELGRAMAPTQWCNVHRRTFNKWNAAGELYVFKLIY